jgi:heptosyltransferase III
MSYGNYPDLKNVRKALVIKMRHHGDVLLSSPVFSNLKRVLPDLQIDAMIYGETLPMLEGHPAISEFLLYDRKWKSAGRFSRLLKEIKLLRQIRKNRYDLVINLTEGDRGAIAAFVSKAGIKVGFDPEDKGMKGKKKMYTHLVKHCKTPRHTVERHLDVLRRIGIFPTLEQRDLTLAIPDKSLDAVRSWLQQASIAEGSYYLIHPVSRWRFKCLSTGQIAQLIQELHKLGHPIVLSASHDPNEMAMIAEIVQKTPGVPLLNLAGKMDLKQLGALIQLSKGLICVDSVPLHMSSALKIPVIALFGPSSDKNWGPWNNPRGKVVAQSWGCRPCHMDGCGGSKMSDCLYTLPVKNIIAAL